VATQHKALTVTGWVLTVLIALLFLFSATMKFLNPPDLSKEFVGRFGYPAETTFPIGVVEAVCVVLFLIPQTSVLGAVLLTGYLGGAIATHVRVSDNFVPPIVIGVMVWVALYLREPRLRALLPFRSRGS
jgi:uncharacterized membrane protein YphA (DoxX/SURF4 family)